MSAPFERHHGLWISLPAELSVGTMLVSAYLVYYFIQMKNMKNHFWMPAIFLCMLTASACAVGYVTDQPADVVYTRPASPGEGYVWIDGDWYWGGGSYQWRAGRWDRPRNGRRWVGGNWEHSGRGYRWRQGHWGR
jgi:hypothetical protein